LLAVRPYHEVCADLDRDKQNEKIHHRSPPNISPHKFIIRFMSGELTCHGHYHQLQHCWYAVILAILLLPTAIHPLSMLAACVCDMIRHHAPVSSLYVPCLS